MAKSVTNALSSVQRLHSDLGADTSAFHSPLLARWRRALPLTFGQATQAAPPLPLPLLERLCELARGMGPEGEIVAALLAVCFFTMARLSSLLGDSARRFDSDRLPTQGDLRSVEGGYLLNLKWSKTRQQLGGGEWLPLVARKHSAACPVGGLSRLRQLLHLLPASAPLFAQPPSATGQGGPVRHLTMSSARRWLHSLLWALGEGGKGYTFHSFRRGACTLAFARGCQLSDIKLLGGWRSDAVNLYYSGLDARSRVAGALASTPS